MICCDTKERLYVKKPTPNKGQIKPLKHTAAVIADYLSVAEQ